MTEQTPPPCRIVQIDGLYQIEWNVPLKLRGVFKRNSILIPINCLTNKEAEEVLDRMGRLLDMGIVESILAHEPHRMKDGTLCNLLAQISYDEVPRMKL